MIIDHVVVDTTVPVGHFSHHDKAKAFDAHLEEENAVNRKK
jgi:hypothetical protein